MQSTRCPNTTPPKAAQPRRRPRILQAWALGACTLLTATTSSGAEPELPRTYLDTTYAPATGATISVPAGGDLQSAIDQANPGDVILLEAGATFTGNFTLPPKTGASMIQIRTAAPDSSLPSPGARIDPSYSAVMAKLESPNDLPAIDTPAGAHHYRLIGLEITFSGAIQYDIVRLGPGGATSAAELPHDLVIDRCYIHGHATGNVKNGIALNSASTAIIDSQISEIHAESGASAFEAHGIAAFHGSGPYKIVNNRIEASHINLFLGGTVPAIDGVMPSDLEIRQNHLVKPLSWRPDDASFAGTTWGVKNLFELKYGRRVLVEGNLLEQVWPSDPNVAGGPQHGWAVLMTVRDEGGAAPWVSIEDVTFQSNVVQRANCGFQLYGTEGQGLHRVKIANNLMVDIGEGWGSNDRTGRWFQTVDTTDLVIDHNTMLRNNSEYLLTEIGSGIPAFSFTNTIVEQGAGITGIAGDAFANNAIIGASSATYPATNFFPAAPADVKFEDLAAGNYRLASDSPYKNAATDGKDVGVDWGSFDAAQAGTSGGSAGTSSGGAPASGGSSGAGGAGGSGAAGSGAAAGTGTGGTPDAGVGASSGSGASAAGEDEGGCGCRVVHAPRNTDGPFAAALSAWLLGAAGLWRRRRRHTPT